MRSNSSCRPTKFGPLMFQCACFACNCRSMASARCSLSISIADWRVVCERSLLVSNMHSSSQQGDSCCLESAARSRLSTGIAGLLVFELPARNNREMSSGRLDSRIHDLLPELERVYTDIHAHPELSMQETRTARIASDRL